ncbi:MAG: 5-dehydro-4-deoxy-D-glucuronate isomerase, partial [Deinococcales bacterium]|nr:5-dehydro-4-deoxy-D-glucuronate isomerase [Chitinophagaceae bacterium]
MSAISLKTLHAVHYNDAKHYTTQQLREQFLLLELENNDAISLTYMHYDRMITGIAKPIFNNLVLPTYTNLKSDYFLERREIGIINTGAGRGTITVDGIVFELNKYDCLYIGKGVKDVVFSSATANDPAVFFLQS